MLIKIVTFLSSLICSFIKLTKVAGVTVNKSCYNFFSILTAVMNTSNLPFEKE
jgi:hypothetical protein